MAKLALAAVTALGLGSQLCAGRAVQALPKYAEREGKSCAYCHATSAGGGARTYRGDYYSLHAYSFAFFDDDLEAAKAGVPVGPDAQPPPKSLLPPTRPLAAAVLTVATTVSVPAAPSDGGPTPIKKAAGAVASAQIPYEKHPTLESTRNYANALAHLAKAIWESTAAPASQRYSEAKRLYARALGLDPTSSFAGEQKRKMMDEGLALGLESPVPVAPGTVFTRNGEYILALRATPEPLRPNTLEIRVTKAGTNAPVGGLSFTSDQIMPGMSMDSAHMPGSVLPDGNYRLPLAFTMMGVWRVHLTGKSTDGAAIDIDLEFDAGGITWKDRPVAGFRVVPPG